MPSCSARRPLPVIATGALGVAVALVLAGCGPLPGSGSAGSDQPGGGEPATRGPVAVPTSDLARELGCPDDTPLAVAQRVDLPTQRPEAVLVAHCQSAAGSPPDGVYLVTGTSSGGTGGGGSSAASGAGGTHTGAASRVSQTLVAASDQLDVAALTRTGDTVRMTGRGYSGPDVPRCCPDVAVTKAWRLVGDRLVPTG